MPNDSGFLICKKGKKKMTIRKESEGLIREKETNNKGGQERLLTYGTRNVNQV